MQEENDVAITIKDIAEELGVSFNTVSRALRDMPDIGQDTTRLVKETAARLGYRKNFAASYLKTTKSMMLGIIVPDICNTVFSYMYKGIEKKCSETNYSLLLGNSNGNPEEESSILNNMLDHGVDGVFLIPNMKNTQSYTQLENARIPYVVLQRKFADLSTNLVQSNDYEGGYLAAEHLYQLGHRRFLYISAHLYISSALDRYNGFMAYLKEQNLDESVVQILECDSTRSGGYKAAKKWLEKQADLTDLSATAIFCFSDYVAYGVFSAIAKFNLRIPEDISVIGYDNNEYSDMTSPALTTVDILPYQIGKQASKIMFNLIQNKETINDHIEAVISPKLIVRNSTKQIDV